MADEDNQRIIGRIEMELNSLSVDEACSYYKNYINNYQNSQEMAASFLRRLGGERDAPSRPEVSRLQLHAANWLSWSRPLELYALKQRAALPGGNDAATVLQICQATNAEPEMLAQLQNVQFGVQGDELRGIAVKLLERNPMYVLVADLILRLDFFEGRLPDERLALFKCPKVLQPLWNLRLFRHHAGLTDMEGAAALWSDAFEQPADPATLNLAAEMFRRAGDAERARGLYERSLAADPLQHSVALRLRELNSPFKPLAPLVGEKKVCIYLYSYNKAQLLLETLLSLAASDIGRARIKILLNGCTDDSAAVAGKAAAMFPGNDVEIISLPVNIGAPAARNWLISQPSTWESDYVAFLDDDVELQPDWLSQFLTVAEADRAVANVGCKVVFPGKFRMIQYLYRYVSVATQQMIRVSLPTPGPVYDTGMYDVHRLTRVVMGCQHLMRVSALKEVPWFDIRYSPSQVDDTDHDLQFCLKGHLVAYCGTTTCVHKHSSGVSMRSGIDFDRLSNVNGNDVKFFYKYLGKLDEMSPLDSLSLNR